MIDGLQDQKAKRIELDWKECNVQSPTISITQGVHMQIYITLYMVYMSVNNLPVNV